MKLVFLGTSAAQPSPERGLACTCLVREGEVFMFDAGEAAQIAYMRAGLGWNKRMKILVTHLHGDHCIGILGMLQTMSLRGRTEALEIYGPGGIDEFVRSNIRALGFGLTFPVTISAVEEGEVVGGRTYSIHACAADHSVAAYSYRFDEKDRPGRFFPERAREAGVPEGRLWGALQGGDAVVVGGRRVEPSQVLGERRPGRRIGVSGDTRPTARLAGFFRGCDYLVFDTTFLDDAAGRAAETKHSTAAEAGRFARDAGVGNLIMTHFSARYRDAGVLAEEGRRFHGSVVAASDLMEIEIA